MTTSDDVRSKVEAQIAEFERTLGLPRKAVLNLYLADHYGVAAAKLDGLPIVLTGSAAAGYHFPDWPTPNDVDLSREEGDNSVRTDQVEWIIEEARSQMALPSEIVGTDMYGMTYGLPPVVFDRDKDPIALEADCVPAFRGVQAELLPVVRQWADLPPDALVAVETDVSLLRHEIAGLIDSHVWVGASPKSVLKIARYLQRGVDPSRAFGLLDHDDPNIARRNNDLRSTLREALEGARHVFDPEHWAGYDAGSRDDPPDFEDMFRYVDRELHKARVIRRRIDRTLASDVTVDEHFAPIPATTPRRAPVRKTPLRLDTTTRTEGEKPQQPRELLARREVEDPHDAGELSTGVNDAPANFLEIDAHHDVERDRGIEPNGISD